MDHSNGFLSEGEAAAPFMELETGGAGMPLLLVRASSTGLAESADSEHAKSCSHEQQQEKSANRVEPERFCDDYFGSAASFSAAFSQPLPIGLAMRHACCFLLLCGGASRCSTGQ